MELTARNEKSAAVIIVRGRIDATTAPQFEKGLEESTAGENKILVLSMSDLNYISSAGLRVVLQAAKDLKARQGDIFLVGLKGKVKEILELSGFLSIFKTFETEEEALAQV